MTIAHLLVSDVLGKGHLKANPQLCPPTETTGLSSTTLCNSTAHRLVSMKVGRWVIFCFTRDLVICWSVPIQLIEDCYV